MSIFDSVSETIKRYGNSVRITTGKESTDVRAFVQPLRYKNRVYIGGSCHKLGYRRIEKYLYIGLPDYEIVENSSVIEMKNRKYIVKRCEKYYLRDIPVYIWAVLQPYGTDLEDEYESN